MHVLAYAPLGADGVIVRVEVDIRRGIPGIDITGLADGAVKEARERIRAGFRNSGFKFPSDRILINLAPADVKKAGASLDLPIAISVMAAAGLVSIPGNLMVLGELELSGRVRPVRGVLAALSAGLKAGITEFIVPLQNAEEAALLPGLSFFAPATLAELYHALNVRAQTGELPAVSFQKSSFKDNSFFGDFSEVKGQSRYKRALEIAAAGGHNLLVFGPPGSGKTMLARCFPGIMAPLSPDEAVEVTRLHSLAGQISGGLINRPPFRSPHHSASTEGILGGGRIVRPGEITLAHFGTLFLDEAPEFRASVLQSLREPLEDRQITIVRAEGPMKLPANFQLILAANGCPCGRLGADFPAQGSDPGLAGCFCSPDEIRRYWRKLSGALLDRIELRIPVSKPDVLTRGGEGEEGSDTIRERVIRAVEVQRNRFTEYHHKNRLGVVRRNADMSPALIEAHCLLSKKAGEIFSLASLRLGLSGRACHGVLKIARTIADLGGKDIIDTHEILEAIQHRRFGDDPYDILSAGE